MSQPQEKFLLALLNAGGEVYQVGGPVRDFFLNRATKDNDLLVRKLPLEKLKLLLVPFGKMALVGKSFGVLKFQPHDNPQQEYDIALPRKERSTGPKHTDFEVDFDPELSVEEDLGRRDFTINAMALRLSDGLLIDPFGGSSDLQNKILRLVFEKAFEEDPLRLLRAVQFAARFEMAIEEKTWALMKKEAEKIKTVSDERIIEEIRKLLLAQKPSRGFDLMRDCGLLPHIFPDIANLVGVAQDKLPNDDVYGHTMRVLDSVARDEHVEQPGDLELMFAALFHDAGKAPTRKYDAQKDRTVFYGHQHVSKKMWKIWSKKMKVTVLGLEPKNVAILIDNHMFETKSFYTDKAIRRFVNKISPDLIYKLLDLRLADNRGGKHPNSIGGVVKMRKRVREELAKKPPFGPKDLALNGHDLMTLMVPAGPQMGNVIKQLVEIVLDDPNLNTKEALIKIVQQGLVDNKK